jgi:tRNA(Ile2) C34 agmatinyltransferase TiaS
MSDNKLSLGEKIRLAKNDICPECRGELDTGWECNSCGYDAMSLVTSEIQQRTWRKRSES